MLDRVRSRALGRRRGLLVAAEAVVEHRGGPVRVRGDASCSGRGLLDGVRYRRGGLGFPSLQRQKPQQRGRMRAAPGCRRDAVGLGDVGGGTREVADPRARHAERGEVERQRSECAGIAHEPDLAR